MIFVDRIRQDKLEEGISMSIANAERLLSDAELLFKNSRYASARVIAMLSWEETAKAYFMFNNKENRADISEDEWRRKFSRHVAKLDGVQNIMGFYGEPLFEDDSVDIGLMALGFLEDHSTELKNTREGLTYVDYDFNNNRWVSPDSVFVRFFEDEEADCSEVIGIAGACIAWVKEQLK